MDAATVAERTSAGPPGTTKLLLDSAALLDDLGRLRARRDRGDVNEKAFGAALAERVVGFARDAARARLAAGEAIVAEHHAVHGHLRLARSVLDIPDEESVSLLLSERRLVRVRLTLTADGRPPASGAPAELDEIPLALVRGLRVRRQIRVAEVGAGVCIVAVALALGPLLLITGKLLVGLGVLGVLHGLLLPTRTITITTAVALEPPLQVTRPRRRSARRLLARLRAGLTARPPAAEAALGSSETDPGVAAVARRRGAPLRVLVVDDEAVFRETLAKVLARRGLSAALAASGAEALRRLDEESVDVVVLDLKMPELDGLETLQRIRARRPGVPVIILTGHGSAAAGLDAIRGQAFDFLLKPIDIGQLVLSIEHAAASAGTADPAAVTRPTTASPTGGR
jgi:CheY-like chemotaxis protein